jgi:dTDP-glucose 4,6-dehydratase
LILITIRDFSNDQLKHVNSICEELKIEVRIVPSMKIILNEEFDYSEMKTIDLADILGRKILPNTSSEIKSLIKDKKILVTGAGGSIGSEIVRQLNNYSPKKIGCLDRDESSLHALELSLLGSGLLLSENMILADLRDSAAIEKIIDDFKPDIVFHAGALKHVVMLERYPEEAFKTNVLGTKNLVQSCLKHDVKLFLNISTDKAAMPISVLGNTKLQAEKIVTEANLEISSNKKYLSVRFGNVLGSRGSFLDTFKFQIDNGLPVTITDKNVQRYFMTVEEAVFLVLQSAAIGPKGSVLFLDMGNPVRIEDVAKKLIKQSGKDIEIKYSGLRQGEKMDEVLFDIKSQICELIQPGIFQIKEKIK